MNAARQPEHGSATGWRRDPSVVRGATVRIIVDGESITAHDGEALAISLAIHGILALRHSPTAETPRGVFCLMGACQECLVHVDGVPCVACMEPVRDGMCVTLDKLAHDRAVA